MNSITKKTVIASGVALALGAPIAQAVQLPPTDIAWSSLGFSQPLLSFNSDSANMTMLDSSGYTVGGTNDVNMMWDGSLFTSTDGLLSDYHGPSAGCTPTLTTPCTVSNITASSTTPFFGYNWTAHDIQAFAPGTYSFDTSLGGGNAETGMLNATVGLGQFGVHMLFDWNGNENIDVFVVADAFSQFGSGTARSDTFNPSYFTFGCDSSVTNCLWDGKGYGSAGKPAGDQTWMLSSTDPDGDGIMGIPMAPGGPFAGFNANFNVNVVPGTNAVPVPAAVWLFGSGLLGLVGVARRRKRT